MNEEKSTEPIVLLSYVSKQEEGFEITEVKKIMSKSMKANEKANITGILLYNTKYFFQIIEGSRKDVTNLFSIIYNDSRHYDVELICVKNLPARNFPNWNMTYTPFSKLVKTSSQISDMIDLTPYNINSHNLEKVVVQLKNLHDATFL